MAEGRAHSQVDEAQATAEAADGKKKLVLFTGPGGSRMAVPLELLARLENIPGSQVERAGNQWVTQYRGQILPLIRVSHALRTAADGAGGRCLVVADQAMLQVLVLESGAAIFRTGGQPDPRHRRKHARAAIARDPGGVLHSSVIADRVTELLDVPALLAVGERYEPAMPPDSRPGERRAES